VVRKKQTAAVSGPGRMSRRTDLTPAGNSGQPNRVPSGGEYGERKAMSQQQNAAPMQRAAPPGMVEGAFGPTRASNEPITAGAPMGEGPGPSAGQQNPLMNDPDMMLRAIYRAYPHPDIARMLMRRRPGA